jgi:RNA polymerase sigma factor (sigma-70 family)
MATDAPDPLARTLARLALAPDDEEAWKQLYRLTWPYVRGIMAHRLGSLSGAVDDAGQEVYLRLVRHADFARVNSPEGFRHYLSKVCTSVANDYLERAQRQWGHEVTGLPVDPADPQAWPEHAGQLDELLSAICGQLTAQDRHLLRLLLRGYSLPRIAQALKLPYQTAASRLHRLRQNIRKYLGKADLGDEAS